MEVIVKMKKERKCQGEGGRGQGGCEWRSKAFVKIQKDFLGGGGGGGVGRVEGVRVDVNRMWTEKWSFCEYSKKKKNWGGGGGIRSGGGVGEDG